MNPFVFFVGCPRSGTTLLRRIGEAHTKLAMVHETRWIARTWEQRRGLTANGLVTARLIERMRDPRRLEPLSMNVEDLYALDAEGMHFAKFVTTLFDHYASREAKPLVGDKSPGYVRYISTLHGLWPSAKFVHIVRDGRDVALSVLDWRKGATSFATFDEDPIATIAVWWEWYVRLGREAAGGVRGLYHELRYESLVGDKEAECRRLCVFLGIEYEPQMLQFHAGKTKLKPGLSSKSSWLPITAGLRDWRTQMDPDDARCFEAAAGDLMDELGYERVGGAISRASRDYAAGLRARFVEQAIERQRPVPQAWMSGVRL